MTEPQRFEGDYTESAEDTAARWSERNEGANREIVLLLPHEQYDRFFEAVGHLQEWYEEESKAQTIFRAVTDKASELK